jgi:sporulation protein YlmC with PRC-barrel domain
MTRRAGVRLERLLGRLVVDHLGVAVGRIEDVETEPKGETYLVTHVILGPEGRIAQLFAFGYPLPTRRALGLGRKPRTRRLPWRWLDLSDPEHPRLRRDVGSDE